MDEPKRLLTVLEVAELLGVPRRAVYLLIAGGRLPAVRVGRLVRVAPQALDDFVANGGDPRPLHIAPEAAAE